MNAGYYNIRAKRHGVFGKGTGKTEVCSVSRVNYKDSSMPVAYIRDGSDIAYDPLISRTRYYNRSGFI